MHVNINPNGIKSTTARKLLWLLSTHTISGLDPAAVTSVYGFGYQNSEFRSEKGESLTTFYNSFNADNAFIWELLARRESAGVEKGESQSHVRILNERSHWLFISSWKSVSNIGEDEIFKT